VKITRAFSLLEIIAVLAILAIAAAAVTLRVQAPLQQATLKDLAGQLAAFDHLTRVQARETDRPLRLVFDLGQGRLRRTAADGAEDRGAALELPADWTIARLCVAGEEAARGEVVVPCSRLGLTPSYALCLEGPGKVRQWIIVAGLSGEAVLPAGESEAHEYVAAAKLGPDAH
jgi:prepilin-type N-terminal cleavage/methylation domain-containing protein